MKIVEITVECGTTLPHPKQAYSSIRESVSAKATLEAGESPGKATAKLQEYLGKLLAERVLARLERDL